MRRLLSLLALVAIVVVPPVALGTLGFTAWGTLSPGVLLDVRLVLAILTVVGWGAWAVWVLSIAVEAVTLLTSGRLRLRLPLPRASQALAGTLLAAVLASPASLASAATPAPTAPASVVAEHVTEPAAGEAPRAAEREDAAVVTHRVRLGDDLWGLAERYYGSGDQWRRISAANPALQARPTVQLAEGIDLVIVEPFHTVTVRAGDTLRALAAQHLGDESRWPEIRRLNADRITDPDLIAVGWQLRIPVAAGTLSARGPETPTPVTPVPASVTPVPAPATPQATPAGNVRPDEATPLLGTMTAVTASAVLGGLAVRRRAQAQSRPLGRRYAPAGAELERFETALGVRRADVPEPPSDELIARALRHLGRCWFERQVPAPRLARARVGDDGMEFAFAEALQAWPDGFVRDGDCLTVTWEEVRSRAAPDHPVAYPALVTLGRDPDGRLVMVDLVATGVLGLRGEEELVASSLSAMLVELTCAPWAAAVSLEVVTEQPAFARVASVGRVVCAPTAESAVVGLERRSRQRAGHQGEAGPYDRARLDPDLADAWAPHIVWFESPPDADLLARVEDAVGAGVGLAAALAATDAVGPASTWDLDQPVRALVAAGLPEGRLEPQSVPAAAREAIAALYERADSDVTHPAPWWPAGPSGHTEEPEPVNIVTLHPAPQAVGPVLRLLGPVDLQGAAGVVPSRAVQQCLEYLAWLLEHPGATATQMTNAMVVAEGTRRSNLSRLRSWLGEAPDGRPYLPDAYSGRIEVDADVTSDWHRAQLLVAGGVSRATTARLVAVLELVRGAPLADAAPHQWRWAEELRSDMAALVRDVGVVLARRAAARQDHDLARWAASRALTAAPDDELLLCERIRTEHAAGHAVEVQRLVNRVTAQAARLGVDLLPETVVLCQEVLEGGVRSRRAY